MTRSAACRRGVQESHSEPKSKKGGGGNQVDREGQRRQHAFQGLQGTGATVGPEMAEQESV